MLVIIISRSSLKLGNVGSKIRSLGQQATQVSDLGPLWPSCIQCSFNFVRMLIIIISRSSLKLGHGGSKTRSLGQILEKPCVHSRGHSFDPKFTNLCQKVNHYYI